MLTTGITLTIIGLVLAFGAGIFAMLNMRSMVSKPGGFQTGFKRHFTTMIPGAIGGLLVMVGLLLIIIHFVQAAT